MDCELCIHLLLLLDLIPNNIGMASVSSVPLSYIFLRGQGVKINSIAVKECSKLNTRIPTLENVSKPPEELCEWWEKDDKKDKSILRKQIIYYNYDHSNYKNTKDYEKQYGSYESKDKVIHEISLLSER